MKANETMTTQPPPKSSMTLGPLTPDERGRIRAMLDKHFDDGRGRYLDGMSDHKIADKLNIPAIHVKNIREAAYGPERADPELDSLMADMAKLEAGVEASKREITIYAEKAKAEIDAKAEHLVKALGNKFAATKTRLDKLIEAQG